MAEGLSDQIEFELQMIDKLFTEYASLLARCSEKTPDLVDTTAVAGVLHSFYSGLENVFTAIAKELDGGLPSGAEWHRQLLRSMAAPSTGRGRVISASTELALRDYLAFRHAYRHSYSFLLDWNRLRRLVVPLATVWAGVKVELQSFAGGLTEP